MRETRKSYFLVAKDDADDAGVPVVMDLLRYDVATPANPAPQPPGFYLVSTPQAGGLTVRRWESRGISVVRRRFAEVEDAMEWVQREEARRAVVED